jgi:PAS domain S-box-containing protein
MAHIPNREAARNALRRTAEGRLAQAGEEHRLPTPAEAEVLLHELSVHQIELEMQNEELRSAQDSLEQSRNSYARLFDEAPVGFVTLNPDLRIVRANPAAAALVRMQRAHELVGRRLALFVRPEDLPLYQRALARVLQRRGPQKAELRLQTDGAAPVWVSMEMVLTAAEDGGFNCHVALSDIGERIRLQESRARLAAIVESSDDAIVGRDLDGIVTSWNQAAERLFGPSEEQAIGSTMDTLIPQRRRDEEVDLLRRLRRGEHIHHFESERIVRDGSAHTLSISMSPLRNSQGQVIGSSLIARDVSHRRRAEEALSQRLRQLEVLSHAGQSLIMGDLIELPLRNDLFDRVREAVGCDVHLIYTLAADGAHLHLRSLQGLPEDARARLGSVPVDDSLCGLAAQRRDYLVVNDLQASDLPAARHLREAGLRSYAGFPLLAHGRVYGVAGFASTTRDTFRGSDVMVIRSVCDQVSAMLERTRLMNDLREREQTLERADRAKNEFIATLAHELRNPLAPIRNAVSMMRRGPALDTAQRDWCREIIERQVVQMTHLLEDLLDVSRLSRHSIALRRERVELSRVLEQALEATRALMRARGHELELQAPEAPIVIDADLTRLTQVFTNLLDNAAKYTEPGGRIGVVVEPAADGARVRVRVRDNGSGITPQFLPHVFDMFARQGPGAAGEGLGIGLALARGLVELHDATIEASSEGPGRGSEFVVSLPIAAPLRAPGASAPQDAPLLPRLRMLVVDDNVDAAQTLGAVLELEGQDVRLAYDAEQALLVSDAWTPEVAVLDIGLPDSDGYTLCRELRARAALRPGTARLVVVACTGWGQAQDLARAREAGFDAHLVKPIDPIAILQAVAAARAGAAPAV